jgi:hypothetical protein
MNIWIARRAKPSPNVSDSELVVVRTFLSRIEADLAKSALEAAGIEALVQADDAGMCPDSCRKSEKA